ncbi:MAG: archaeosine biosynthesis radical SAM protein RaSEA [Candidatus Saganbacteria bacterium]|nr:archaeosine biosynthesis radical SAM protein RaSEA [Candidatus Saganbacteria bacterium]
MEATKDSPKSGKYSYIDYLFDPLKGETICRWVLMLPGAGCSWSKEKHGGCHMCGFKHENQKYTLGFRFPTFIFTTLFNMCLKAIKHKKPELLAIFNGGSFTNDKEIPHKTQLKICKKISQVQSVERVLIESRPEHITTEKIKLLISHLKEKQLIVGLGLECVSDEIRNKSINKGFLKKDYEKAIDILKALHVQVLTYILIKPLFLSEKEAIDHAVESAEYAFSKGSDYVVFNAAMVQKNTKMEEFYSSSKYTPPWLWSLVEIAKRTHHLGAIRIGDLSEEPTPLALPQNCDKCTPLLMERLKQFKKTHNIKVFDDLGCDCQEKWQQELTRLHPTLT